MAKPDYIELGDGTRLPILYEDRSALAVDKPPGWMLVPFTWQRTRWNLQAAIESALGAGLYWARSRNLRFLRYVHRLDAETSGVLLFAKNRGALDALANLFERRQVRKTYLVVLRGEPRQPVWTCRQKLGPHPGTIGRMRVDDRNGKPSETCFRVLATRKAGRLGTVTLAAAEPYTGRTHQIRVHAAASGCPVLDDPLYGQGRPAAGAGMALRSVRLAYADPFTGRPVDICATTEPFLQEFGFVDQASAVRSEMNLRA